MSETQEVPTAGNLPPAQGPAAQAPDALRQPIRRFSFGRIHAPVWRRQYNHGQRTVTTHDISIFRKYQDGAGTWHESHSFSQQDLLCVRVVINKAIRSLKLEEVVNRQINAEPRSVPVTLPSAKPAGADASSAT
jgi:hypothetical protein